MSLCENMDMLLYLSKIFACNKLVESSFYFGKFVLRSKLDQT